MNMELNIH